MPMDVLHLTIGSCGSEVYDDFSFLFITLFFFGLELDTTRSRTLPLS